MLCSCQKFDACAKIYYVRDYKLEQYDKAKNFHLTRTYDKLTRIMNDRNATLPIAQERAILYLGQLRDDAQKFG